MEEKNIHLEDTDLLNDRISPKMTNVGKYRSLYVNFVKQHNDLWQQSKKIGEKLQDFLQVNNTKESEFEKYIQSTQTAYDKFLMELELCEALKSEKIQIFVEKLREEIESWWDRCLKSQKERQRFTSFKSTEFTEDLLTIHEMELNDLKSFYENNEDILKTYHKLKDFGARMQKLEIRSQDPNRYTNRGGILLKEERDRNSISKRLSKLEAEMHELGAAYQNLHKRPFTFYGRTIEETIQSDWEQMWASKKKENTPTNLKSNHVTTKKTPRSVESNLPVRIRSKATNVTRSATTLRAVNKRKLPATPSMAHAKRSLLKELLNSPALISPSKPVTKQSPSPAKAILKVYEAGSATKRRSKSGKDSMSLSKRRLSNSLKVPQLHFNGEQLSDEEFECFLEIDPKEQGPNGQIINAGNNVAGHTPDKPYQQSTISCSCATKKSPAASRATSHKIQKKRNLSQIKIKSSIND